VENSFYSSLTLNLIKVCIIIADSNILLNKGANQLSTVGSHTADKAVNGIVGNSLDYSQVGAGGWWAVDIGYETNVATVKVYSQVNVCRPEACGKFVTASAHL